MQLAANGMTELMPVHQEDGQFWVDARTLHATLQVGRDFSTWITARLDETGAVEGPEFIVLDGSPVLGNAFNPKPRRDYWLHIDLGKEVAMMERSEIGKKVRRYFIEAEKKLRAQAGLTLPDFGDPAAAARAWADEFEGKKLALAQVAELAPKAQVYDQLLDATGLKLIDEVAKELGWGPQKFRDQLYADRVLMHRAQHGEHRHNLPYTEHMDAGRFEVKPRTWKDREGQEHTTRTTYMTAKGLLWAAQRYPIPNATRVRRSA